MEPLPRRAQFIRSKMLWEIALGIAGGRHCQRTGFPASTSCPRACLLCGSACDA
jgi:hypothetical protein